MSRSVFRKSSEDPRRSCSECPEIKVFCWTDCYNTSGWTRTPQILMPQPLLRTVKERAPGRGRETEERSEDAACQQHRQYFKLHSFYYCTLSIFAILTISLFKNRYSPWFTPDLTALDHHKNILWRSALASNSPRDKQLFREVRNQYTQSVRKAKASRNLNPVAQCPKMFLDTVKSMENKSTSSQLPTSLRLGNTVTTDKSTVINTFNKHFSTAGHAFHLATIPPRFHLPRPTAQHPKAMQLLVWNASKQPKSTDKRNHECLCYRLITVSVNIIRNCVTLSENELCTDKDFSWWKIHMSNY